MFVMPFPKTVTITSNLVYMPVVLIIILVPIDDRLVCSWPSYVLQYGKETCPNYFSY